MEIHDIERVEFGIYSAEEIKSMSVVKVTVPKLEGEGSVNDPKMGYILGNGKCEKCNLDKDCVGHYGYIELVEPILHPMYYKMICMFLKCFCKKCCKLLITEDQIELNNYKNYKGVKKFLKIISEIETINMCNNCSAIQPKIIFKPTDMIINMEYKQKKDANNKSGTKLIITLTTEDIKKIFDNISDDDVKLLGFDPLMMKPKNLIITNLLVIPPCSRPHIVADGIICDDDLTTQYLEIVKLNNKLQNENSTLTERNTHIRCLKFRVSTMLNNSKNKAKHPTNGRPLKGLKERLVGKGGRLRANLMGKRVDYSARTVIGAESTLKIGEVAIPYEVAKIHTKSEIVNSYNIEKLTKYIQEGKINFLITQKKGIDGIEKPVRINLIHFHKQNVTLKMGDIIIKKINDISHKFKVKNENEYTVENSDIVIRNGKIISRKKDDIKLKIGDIVERQLEKGDIAVFNRQPTLHRGGMMGVRVIPTKFDNVIEKTGKLKHMNAKTFRFNLAWTKIYNADFDGDEMNLHPTQSYETDVEIDMLTNAKNNIITPQESKPAISVTQDALVGSYLMTMKNEDIDREVFFDITMKGQILKNNKYVDVWDEDRVEQIQEILEKYDKEPNVFNGRGLFSLILPATFNYSKENKTHPKEPVVKIIKGVLIEGTLDKNVLGTTHGSIIQFLNKEYGCEITANFIDNVQFMANDWLLSFGFSIGLEDCLITSKENTDEIKNELMKYYMKAQAVEESTINPGIREIRVMGSLSQAKDIGMKIAKDAMKPDNNFLSSVNSGAKGDFFNIAQITGLLGQQNLEGKRVTPQLNNGKRTLPHYPFEIKDIEKKYESRGFIRHSFIRGLNPEEFFFHSMSGREGISDTSMGTSESGYLQRKIVKLFEDIQIQQDGTVRNNNKKIIQFAYGDNMLDPVKTVKVDGKMQFCDIKRLSEKLNNMYENNEEIKTKKEPEIEYEIIKPVKNNKRKKIIKQIKDIDPSINTNNYSVEDLAEKLERLKLEKKNQTEEEDEENNYNLEDITESSEEDTENSKLVSTDFDDEEHEEKEYNEELEREENSDDDDDEDNSIVDDDFDEDNYDMSEEPVMNYEED